MQKGHLSEKSRDRALFMWSFVNLYDSLKDAQIWVREIMIIFALVILTTTLLLSNEWSQMIQMQEKYETITPSFDVVASQPMPRPYM